MLAFPAFIAPIPLEVRQKLAEDILFFPPLGDSILHLPHRSDLFAVIFQKIIQQLRTFLSVSADFEIFLLQGGASLGFVIQALHGQGIHQKAGFICSDFWSLKAQETTERLGIKTFILADSSADDFSHLPSIPQDFPNDLDYIHLTSNNTVAGTQWKDFPAFSLPLFVDMTSDFLHRPVDFSKVDFVYAGAQKSLCATGLGIYIVHQKYLGKNKNIPPILNLAHYKKNEGIVHTPNILGVYTAALVLDYLEKQQLTVNEIFQQTLEKSDFLYGILEKNPHFILPVKKSDRSSIQLVFSLQNPAKKQDFENYLAQNQIHFLQGHRSRGDFRISVYHTVSLEEVKALGELLLAYH